MTVPFSHFARAMMFLPIEVKRSICLMERPSERRRRKISFRSDFGRDFTVLAGRSPRTIAALQAASALLILPIGGEETFPSASPCSWNAAKRPASPNSDRTLSRFTIEAEDHMNSE
ncbi:MAG TPA: hypothetical protein IAB86_04640 [Candidatus Aphodovivens avicola]|nr:hypothetical protein [Candidatus Aphodovivens avicola]